MSITPTAATLFMTDACNFRCTGCKRQVDGFNGGGDITLPTVERLLELYPSINSVCIAGLGEPTLCPELPEIIGFLKREGKYVGVISNGTNIEPILNSVIAPDYVSVSLYGFNRQSYVERVKKDVFDTVVANISRLKETLPQVGISFYVNKENYTELQRIIDIGERVDVDFINVTNYLAYCLTDEEISRVIETSDLSIIEEIEKYLDQSQKICARPVYVDRNRFEFFCPSYDNLVNVDGVGNVSFCQRQIPPSPEFGNIFSGSNPFADGVARILRSRIKFGEYPHEICRHCFGRMHPRVADKIDLAVAILSHEKPEQTLECIRSFLRFGCPIYVLDNGSSQLSVEQLEAGIAGFTSIILIRSLTNLGVANGRNHLIENIEQQWIFFVDNDITINGYNLYDLLRHEISSDPKIEAFIPRLFNVHEGDYVIPLKMCIENDQIQFKNSQDSFTNYFPGGASIVNKSIFSRVGLYDHKMFIGLEDMELSLRSLVAGHPIRCKIVPQIELVHDHRVVSSSPDREAIVTRYDMNIQRRSYLRMREKYPSLAFEHNYEEWIVKQQTQMLGDGYLDLGLLTPETNFGAPTPCPFSVDKTTGRFNPLFTRDLLEALSRKTCGNETFLFVGMGSEYQKIKDMLPNSLFSGPDWEITGNGTFLFDPDHYRGLEGWSAAVTRAAVQLIVVTFLLEKLQDPRPFLRALRGQLFLGRRCILVVDEFSEESALLDKLGYWRQWSLDSCKRLLSSAGFSVRDTWRSASGGGEVFLELSADPREYEIFLRSLYLPPATIEYLVVSQEHSLAPRTGGIGTYVGELEKVVPPEVLALFLTAGGDLLPDHYKCQENRYFVLKHFFGKNKLPIEDAVATALEIIVCLYHQLRVIEFQDVNGKGYRFLQGVKAGLCPSGIMTQVLCHASRLSLERLYSVWIDPGDPELLEEKLVVENADVVKFPTRFLHDFYDRVGYRFDPALTRVERLPFASQADGKAEPNRELDTLIFFGKRSPYKGFDLFIETIRVLRLRGSGFQRILLIGPLCEDLTESDLFFAQLRKDGVLVEELSPPREEAVQILRENADRSVCVLPYVADNHPYALLEVIDSGCLVVATRTGGMPEMIPDEYVSVVLTEANADSLAERITYWQQAPSARRRDFASGLCLAAAREQTRINANLYPNLQRIYANWLASNRFGGPTQDPSICCLIPVDQEGGEITGLLQAILAQTRQPQEIFCLLPGSAPHEESVSQIISSLRDVRIRIHLCQDDSHGSMLNEGLALVESDFVVPLYPGMVPAGGCFRLYHDFFQRNPSYDVVTSYAQIECKGEDQSEGEPKLEKYLGQGVLISQFRNTLGHHFSLYRTSALRASGGFAPAEDLRRNGWATLLGVASRGRRIGVIPRPLVKLHRNNTAPFGERYADQHSLASQTYHLDRFDSFRLQGLARAWSRKEAPADMEALKNHYRTEIETILNSRSWKITKPLRYLARSWRRVRSRG